MTTAEAPESLEETARLPVFNPRTFLGAVRRGVRPGITAALIVEEGCLAAEQKFRKTGLGAAGAILSEGLWAWQLDQERREREGGGAKDCRPR
jgi:hypothetical protein